MADEPLRKNSKGVGLMTGETEDDGGTVYFGQPWKYGVRRPGVDSCWYDKSAKLLHAKLYSSALAAKGILRSEVRMRSLQGTRGIWGLVSEVPTLQAILDPAVQRYVLAREARRLGFHRDDLAVQKLEDLAGRVLHVESRIGTRCQKSTVATRRRTAELRTVWMMATSGLGQQAIADALDLDDVYSHLAELKRLGCTPDTSEDGTRDHTVRTICWALDRDLGGSWWDTLQRLAIDPSDVVRSPWALPENRKAA